MPRRHPQPNHSRLPVVIGLFVVLAAAAVILDYEGPFKGWSRDLRQRLQPAKPVAALPSPAPTQPPAQPQPAAPKPNPLPPEAPVPPKIEVPAPPKTEVPVPPKIEAPVAPKTEEPLPPEIEAPAPPPLPPPLPVAVPQPGPFRYDPAPTPTPEELKPVLAAFGDWLKTQHQRMGGRIADRLFARQQNDRAVLYLRLDPLFIRQENHFRRQTAEGLQQFWGLRCASSGVARADHAHVVLIDQTGKIVGGSRLDDAETIWLHDD